MRQLILFGLLSLFFSCAKQNLFEGEIKYNLNFSPEDAKIDTILLKDYYGEQWTFLFKNGNFRWNMESSDTWIGSIYDQDENKYYYLIKNSGVVSWKKGSQRTDSIISIRNDNINTKILGHACRLLEVKSRLLINNVLRTRRYYYSPDLKINPEWFTQNQDGNFNEIYSRMKAIPLKIVDDFETFSISYEATDITPKRLDDSYFEVKSEHLVEVK
jgi:hypothetical protein